MWFLSSAVTSSRIYRHVVNQGDTRQRGTGTNKMHITRGNYHSLRGNEEGGGVKIAAPFGAVRGTCDEHAECGGLEWARKENKSELETKERRHDGSNQGRASQ